MECKANFVNRSKRFRAIKGRREKHGALMVFVLPYSQPQRAHLHLQLIAQYSHIPKSGQGDYLCSRIQAVSFGYELSLPWCVYLAHKLTAPKTANQSVRWGMASSVWWVLWWKVCSWHSSNACKHRRRFMQWNLHWKSTPLYRGSHIWTSSIGKAFQSA